MDTNDSKTKLLRQYSAYVAVLFVIGAALSFIIASYLNHGTIQYFFSYSGSDGPVGYATSANPTRLGVHVFGDYLLPRWQSELSSPWFIKDAPQGPLNNYLPFTMALFWIYSHFSYWASFFVYMLIPTVVLIFVVWRSLSLATISEKTQFLVTSLFLTVPFISLMDRGNVQIYVVASLALALWLFCKGHGTSGAVALGFAIALKGYPIFLIALWIQAKRWKDVVIAALTSIFLTIVPLLFYDGGVTRNLSRILRNVRLNEDLYAADSLAFNNSLRGTLLTLSRIEFLNLGKFFEMFYEHFTLTFLLVAIVATILILFLEIDVIEIVVLATVLMSTFVDYVGGYALGVYFLFIIAISLKESRIPKIPMRFLMFFIALQMAPRAFPVKFWIHDPVTNEPTYSSLLGGFASLMSGLVVLFVVVRRHQFKCRAAKLDGVEIPTHN